MGFFIVDDRLPQRLYPNLISEPLIRISVQVPSDVPVELRLQLGGPQRRPILFVLEMNHGGVLLEPDLKPGIGHNPSFRVDG